MDIAKQILEVLAATADIERFGGWKGKLEDALKELEEKYKKKKIGKAEYQKRRLELKERLKKAGGEIKRRLTKELEELEVEFKEKPISKEEYEQQKKILEDKIKKASELLKKSQDRLEEAKREEKELLG